MKHKYRRCKTLMRLIICLAIICFITLSCPVLGLLNIWHESNESCFSTNPKFRVASGSPYRDERSFPLPFNNSFWWSPWSFPLSSYKVLSSSLHYLRFTYFIQYQNSTAHKDSQCLIPNFPDELRSVLHKTPFSKHHINTSLEAVPSSRNFLI